MPGLVVTVTGKNGIQPALTDVERSAAAFQRRMQRNITTGLGQWMGTGTAPNPLKTGLKEAASEGLNLNGIMRETLVVFREMERRNWARIPSSMSLIAQYAGVLKYALTPVGGMIAALAVATYVWVKHLREVSEESKNFTELFSAARRKFTDAARAMNDIHEAAMKVNNDIADQLEWEDKLAAKKESATQSLSKKLQLMREEYELQKKIAQERGVPESVIMSMDINMQQKDLDATKSALGDQQKQAADDLARERSLNQQRMQAETELGGKTKKASDFDELAKNVQTIFDQIDSKTKDKIAALQSTIAAATAALAKGYDYSTYSTRSGAQLQLREILSKEFMGNDVGGKKVRASLDEIENVFLDGASKQKLLNRDIEELAKANRKLKDAQADAKSKAEQSSQSVIELTARRDELAKTLALHQQYDSQIAAGQKGGGRNESMSVTERERIGAASSGISVSLLDVSKTQLEVMRQHNAHLVDIIKELREGSF